MRAVYAIALAVGFVGMLVWVARAAIADTVEGWERVDPERRFGPTVRYALAALLGFGLAGLSAAYAGWATGVAFLAAVVGAAFVVFVAFRYGPDDAATDAGTNGTGGEGRSH